MDSGVKLIAKLAASLAVHGRRRTFVSLTAVAASLIAVAAVAASLAVHGRRRTFAYKA